MTSKLERTKSIVTNTPKTNESAAIDGSDLRYYDTRIELPEARYNILLPIRDYDPVLTTKLPNNYAMLTDIRRRLSSADVAIEIGASFGNHAIYLAAACDCTVHTFEADDDLARMIDESISINNFEDRLQLHKNAIFSACEQDCSPITMLDQLELGNTIKVIIINSEHNSLDVLNGARHKIDKYKPYIYVRCSSDAAFIDLYSHFCSVHYTYIDSFNATPTHLFAPKDLIRANSCPEDRPTPVSKLLEPIRQINDRVDKEFRRAPASWLTTSARAAVTVECYDVAKGLGMLGTAMQRRGAIFANNEFAQLLGAYMDAELALGNRVAAEALEKEHRHLCMLDKTLAKHSLVLADRLSRTQIKKILQRFPDEGVQALALNRRDTECIIDSFGNEPTTFKTFPSLNLILANSLNRLDRPEDERTAALRRYMQTVTESDLFSIDWMASNILPTMKFSRTRPCSNEGHLVSIIVSAYNSSNTIVSSIESLLNQTYRNIEVLVCDDCSGDDTLDRVILHFATEPRVTIFKSKGNQGPYNIRNALIARARGAYITFQDADDISLPSRIATQVTALSARGAVANVCNWVRVSPNGFFVLPKTGSFLSLCSVSLMARADVFWAVKVNSPHGPYRSARFRADTEFIRRVGDLFGSRPVQILPVLGLFGLSADGSLTTTAGTEALANGYRSPARRAYSALVLAQRLRPDSIWSYTEVDRQLQSFNAHAQPRGVTQVPVNL